MIGTYRINDMNKAFLYFFGLANVMFLVSITLGGYTGYLVVKLLDINDKSTIYTIILFMIFNTFLIWIWFSDLARKAFIELMQNK